MAKSPGSPEVAMTSPLDFSLYLEAIPRPLQTGDRRFSQEMEVNEYGPTQTTASMNVDNSYFDLNKATQQGASASSFDFASQLSAPPFLQADSTKCLVAGSAYSDVATQATSEAGDHYPSVAPVLVDDHDSSSMLSPDQPAPQELLRPEAPKPPTRNCSSAGSSDSQRPTLSSTATSSFDSTTTSTTQDTSTFPESAASGLPDRRPLSETPPRPLDAGRLVSFAPGTGNYTGIYSSSGFDLLGALVRIATRPNPQINIGPVDTGCSFTVTDARKYDQPIIFASPNFSRLTGYENHEIIGRNCRFLQAPGGKVRQGSKRQYTDSSAVWHLKSLILAGKESQASVINYRKNGTPFINLVTVIPITWDSDEIAYFVGFQVDLVEQPHAILEKMRDGTYFVDYALVGRSDNLGGIRTVSTADADDSFGYREAHSGAEPAAVDTSSILDVISSQGLGGLDNDDAQKAWYRSVLDNSDDFVHVVSLKGAFLYVSPSCKTLLEYDKSELLGKSITSICHPSDSVPVMRELKESSNAQGHPTVSLLYRARRKNSGYIWIEAQGKLHVEHGKGRKCLILVGRHRPAYKMSWTDLERAGGLAEVEFWSKLSLEGMCLYATPSVESVLAFTPDEMIGTAFSQLVPDGGNADVLKAIADAAAGHPVTLKHQLKNRQGQFVEVVTNFFTSHKEPPLTPRTGSPTPIAHVPTVIAQTIEARSFARRQALKEKVAKSPRTQKTSLSFSYDDLCIMRPESLKDKAASATAPAGTYSAVPSTFRTLKGHPSHQNDNIFAELDTTKTSSWQFELHQLKLTNRRLREELEALEAAVKKRKRNPEDDPMPPPPPPGGRACANCGKSDSPEWRKGPSGARDLCNACGLRYSKAVSATAQGGTPGKARSSSAGHGGLPRSSRESSNSHMEM
uniref:Putative LOV domain-containing protein n=1 Tax=Neckera douglasii TaxID=140378 RepID=A0A126X2C8_9BRYO|nr:putative LOV domain-containing protein [Neckera douglasii]